MQRFGLVVRRVAAAVRPDARRLARKLMASLAEAMERTGTAALDGTPVEMRRFLVHGQPTLCLADSGLAGFIAALTDSHDDQLAETISRAGM